jgi:CHAT domain-containing protein
LPGSHSDFAGQLGLYAGVLATASAPTQGSYSPQRFEAMQRSLGHVVIGPVADLVKDAERVFVAPDGFFASIPIGTLSEGDRMLMEARDVVDVPSASVLGWARKNRAQTSGRTTMIAVADNQRAGQRGEFQEVSDLEHHYEGVHRVGASTGVLDTLTRDAGPGRVLHIAAHARVIDDSPWQSGFILESAATAVDPATDPGTQPELMLRAWEIARAKLPYAMAVLAGCETAGGRATNGEGVLGLTSAFLSAGVPAVISSRWAVDDRATAELMRNFYAGLAQGKNVTAALRGAQLAMRSNPRTQHPFYWAGFSVVGDGSRVIAPLERARGHGRLWLSLGVGALLMVVGWAVYRRRPAAAPAA